MSTETLGERIKRLREARHWTQEDLAGLLDTSPRSVSNWENGRNSPRGSMGALREIFGADLDEVADADEDPVIAAINGAQLDEYRKDEVRHVYRRNLAEQQRSEVRGA